MNKCVYTKKAGVDLILDFAGGSVVNFTKAIGIDW